MVVDGLQEGRELVLLFHVLLEASLIVKTSPAVFYGLARPSETAQQFHIITSNRAPGEWPNLFCDERLTAALLDRLAHRAHILDFVGESYRFRQRMQRDAQSPLDG